MTANVQALCWPVDRLGECLSTLAKRTRIATGAHGQPLSPPAGDLREYLRRAAGKLGCECDISHLRLRDLENWLRLSVPAIVRLSPGCFLAILSGSKHRLTVITPALDRKTISLRAVCEEIREPHAAQFRAETESALAGAGIASGYRTAVNAVLRDRIGSLDFDGCITLRPLSGSGLPMWLRQGAIFRNALSLVAVHLAQYLVWLLAWAVLGRMSFNGRIDPGALLGWTLLLATAIPFQLLATWLQGLVAVGAGGLLKRRLLDGALKLRPDEVRHQGIGTFLAQAIEAGAVESLALGGGISGLLAIIDLLVAGAILGKHSILLAAWFAFTVFCGLRFLRSFAHWSAGRFRLTGSLIEKMVGHRTRLTQEPREIWHAQEDSELERYHRLSHSLDKAGLHLLGGVPRGWLIVGLASTLPVVLSGGHSSTSLAILIGGVLLAFNAFTSLVGSFSQVAAAVVAWRAVAPLFQAATRPTQEGELLHTPGCTGAAKVLEADRLTFRYREHGPPVLDNCKVAVHPGDRILLEGPSGGGKTTLASILSGMREPESGLLLSGGLDPATLGSSGWADRVISVPQFHENHVLTETLAFNLLLGRAWPPRTQDLQDAAHVCRELGLGPLLDRMPNGLLQMVGEGGWQLSHGEKTRLFMARALLQNSDLLILDESFGALDPENMQRCLEFTLEQANALMVIAHP